MYLFFLILHMIVGGFLGFALGIASDWNRRELLQYAVLIVLVLMVLLTLIKFGLWWAIICFVELSVSAVIGTFFGITKINS